MQSRDLVLTVIVAGHNRRDLGRTALQKAVFFAGILLGRDTGHTAYYYGPYSAAVEADTETLVTSGLAEEDMRTLGVNKRGFPVTQYQYRATDDGVARVDKLRDKYPDDVEVIQGLVDQMLEVFGSLDQNTLAAAAKTLYIAREQGKEITAEDIASLANDYGWTLKVDKIEDVVHMLQRLEFVQVTDS
jgi:uncharacterized protein YwgA